jgi:predicted transposase YdaD
LHGEVYGEYNEFEEEGMDFSSLRVIEKLHKEMEDVRQSCEEERRFREEAVSRAELDRQRLRDTARNILRLGLSVEQVTQATGLSRETVQTLAAQL